MFCDIAYLDVTFPTYCPDLFFAFLFPAVSFESLQGSSCNASGGLGWVATYLDNWSRIMHGAAEYGNGGRTGLLDESGIFFLHTRNMTGPGAWQETEGGNKQRYGTDGLVFLSFSCFAYDSFIFLGYFAQLLVLGADGRFSKRAWGFM
jgi:hypothetical protein